MDLFVDQKIATSSVFVRKDIKDSSVNSVSVNSSQHMYVICRPIFRLFWWWEFKIRISA